MYKFLIVFGACFLTSSLQSLSAQIGEVKEENQQNCNEPENDGQFLNDLFFYQRSFPDFNNILPGMENARQIARRQMASRSGGFNLQWNLEGPTDIGGRVNVIAIDPTDSSIMYEGTANGGVFKTIDAGATWASVCDTLSYYAIGDIKIDPTNHNTIYVGLGDPNISGYPAVGNGIIKSTDGGVTWNNIGLANTRIISKIEIHPLNPNIVYAAAMGLPYAEDNNRGLYKSSDGGQTWNQVQFINDSAGIIDLLLDNTDTNIVYSVSWNRIRKNLSGIVAGADAKIWKSINGGATWNQLTNGLPTGSFSRISIAKSMQNQQVLYAEYVDSASLDLYGIYKSTNGGANWSAVNTSSLAGQGILGGFGWYFGNITVNPYNDNDIYVPGVDLWNTNDGGNNWNMFTPPWWTYLVHADKHCIRFINQNIVLVCTDGGTFETTDGGAVWNNVDPIPNTQFYHVSYTSAFPGTYFGGAQDNGTTSGNSTSLNTWPRIYGGDGFQQRFIPGNNQIWYSEDQNGAIVYTDDGGATFNDATAGIDPNDVRNWDMPYLVSSFNSNALFTGTTRVYQSTGSYIPSWVPISGQLTGTPNGDSSYRTISTIDQSTINANILYTGTSDGNVWRSTNQGVNWVNITDTLGTRYVTKVKASDVRPNVVFVSHSGYKDNDNIPHIRMSHDTGTTWADISGDLPPFAVNDIELSTLNDSLIFVATDGGVYYTTTMGTHWDRLGINMPFFVIYDIELDQANKKLIAATYARSIWSIGVDSIFNSFNISLSAQATDTICQGSSVQLNVTGAATYSWSPGAGLSCTNCSNPIANPTATTQYVVTGNNGNASATDTITVYVNPAPSAGISRSGDTLFASGGVTYQWYQGNTAIQSATGNIYIVTASGDYSVSVTNQNGCSLQSTTITVTIGSVEEIWLSNNIKIYPNPFSESFLIEKSLPGNWEMTIRDVSGRLINTTLIAAAKTSIDLSLFAGGVYFAEFRNSDKSFVKKILKL